MLVHQFFNMMQFLPTNDKTMKRRSHVYLQERFHWPCYYLLVMVTYSSQSKTRSIRCIRFLLLILFCFQKLLNTFLDWHEFWWLINLLVLENIFLSSLFDLDIDQDQSMQITLTILEYLFIPTIRFPFRVPEWNWNSFPEPVNLQSTTTHCTDDARIVYNLDLDG